MSKEKEYMEAILRAIGVEHWALTEPQLCKLSELVQKQNQLRERWAKQNHEIEQVLAQAIGTYPWYANDQKNFPGATKADGVCTGDNVVDTIAVEAAKTIKELMADRYRFALTVKQRMLEFKDGSVYCSFCGNKLTEDHGNDCIIPHANEVIEDIQKWLLNQNPTSPSP